jgi:replication factor A1
MTSNYYQLIERIAKACGKDPDEVNRLVEAKRAKLSGLISKEGAAQIIAAELNVNFEKQVLKVNELVSGMKKVNLIGKIIKIFPIREYKKENRQGKVANLVVADETGMIKVVLWDVNHIGLVESGVLKQDESVELSGAAVRNSEIHLSSFSDIRVSDSKLENVKSSFEFREKNISDFKLGENVSTRAFIVQAFEPKFFEVCPECNGKVLDTGDGAICEKHGRIAPNKRVLLSIVIDDGTSSTRAILFSENVEKLLTKEQLENPGAAKEAVLGEEILFSGNVRQNKLFNNQELFISSLEKINIEKVIENLEKSKAQSAVGLAH